MTSLGRFRIAHLLTISLMLSSGCATGQDEVPDAPGAFETRLDSLVPGLLADNVIPTVAIGVVEDGRLAFSKGYGRDVEPGATRGSNILYNFASLSKPVTAWGVLKLADDGLIALDAPVNQYLRRWQVPDSEFKADQVTIRRVLSHTAGLSMPSAPWFPVDASPPTLVQILSGERGDGGALGIATAPGARWTYSGGGYALLELLIEEVTGEAFETYMRRGVFEPLGMGATTFAPAAVAGPGVAEPVDENGDPVEPYRLVGTAAGGLYSTVEDFALLLTAYARRGAGIISPATFETMTSPMVPVELDGRDLGGAAYGLGHGIRRDSLGGTAVHHSGGNPGYIAYFLVDLSSDNGLVVVSNGGGAVGAIVAILTTWSEHYGVVLPALY